MYYKQYVHKIKYPKMNIAIKNKNSYLLKFILRNQTTTNKQKIILKVTFRNHDFIKKFKELKVQKLFVFQNA